MKNIEFLFPWCYMRITINNNKWVICTLHLNQYLNMFYLFCNTTKPIQTSSYIFLSETENLAHRESFQFSTFALNASKLCIKWNIIDKIHMLFNYLQKRSFEKCFYLSPSSSYKPKNIFVTTYPVIRKLNETGFLLVIQKRW